MFYSTLSNFLKPFGLSVAALLVLGGPNVYRDFEKLAVETTSITDRQSFRSWLLKIQIAQAELLRINWKATAPAVFCNEFAISWDSESKTCGRVHSKTNSGIDTTTIRR